MKTTRKNVEGFFERVFLPSIGGRQARSYNDVGAYRLDYIQCYGGFVIEKIISEHGAVTHPFGNERRKTSAMFDAMSFFERTYSTIKGE